jgi:hypothetical protein
MQTFLSSQLNKYFNLFWLRQFPTDIVLKCNISLYYLKLTIVSESQPIRQRSKCLGRCGRYVSWLKCQTWRMSTNDFVATYHNDDPSRFIPSDLGAAGDDRSNLFPAMSFRQRCHNWTLVKNKGMFEVSLR